MSAAGHDFDAAIIGAGTTASSALAPRRGRHEGRRLRAPRRGGGRCGHRGVPSRLPQFAASYTVSLLNPRVIRDLRLAERGLRVVEHPCANFLPTADGGYLKVGGGLSHHARRSARNSRRATRSACRRTTSAWRRWRMSCADMLLETPPNVGGGLTEILPRHWESARRLNRLPIAAERDVLDLFTMAAGDWLERWFESQCGRGLLSSTAWSAISRARGRRARPMCCCTTCSGRSTAGRARGGMPWAAWGRSRRRSPAEARSRGVQSARR